MCSSETRRRRAAGHVITEPDAMNATDNEIRIYQRAEDPKPGSRAYVEVEGLDGTHPLIDHTDTNFAWGYGGAGPSTLAQCIVIDTLGRDARCKRCAGEGIDPDSGREETKCWDCGGDGRSDLVALAVPVVKAHLIAAVEQDAPFQFTSEDVIGTILGV